MHSIKKCISVLLVLVLLFSMAACGKAPDTLAARFKVLYRTEMPQDVPAELKAYADSSAYTAYNVEVTVSNHNDYAVNILGLIKNKEAENVRLYAMDESTIGLPAQFTGEQSVFYRVLAAKDLSMEEVLQVLNKSDIRLQYVDASTGIEAMDEAGSARLLESAILYQP